MSKPDFSLEGKVAIVTGARRGHGKEMAITFAEAGADVAVCDIEVESGELESVAKEIKKLGRRSLASQVDVTKKADVENWVKAVVHEFNTIDILVNNVGISLAKPFLEVVEEDYDLEVDTNLKSQFLCAQAAGRVMAEKGHGAIINMSSIMGIKYGKYGWKWTKFKGMTPYAVAKAGVVMLTKAAAFELAEYNIRVNCIAPIDGRAPVSAASWSPEWEKDFASWIPLGRVADPKDIAATALFLASDASSFITGHTVLVDGGTMT